MVSELTPVWKKFQSQSRFYSSQVTQSYDLRGADVLYAILACSVNAIIARNNPTQPIK